VLTFKALSNRTRAAIAAEYADRGGQRPVVLFYRDRAAARVLFDRVFKLKEIMFHHFKKTPNHLPFTSALSHSGVRHLNSSTGSEPHCTVAEPM